MNFRYLYISLLQEYLLQQIQLNFAEHAADIQYHIFQLSHPHKVQSDLVKRMKTRIPEGEMIHCLIFPFSRFLSLGFEYLGEPKSSYFNYINDYKTRFVNFSSYGSFFPKNLQLMLKI